MQTPALGDTITMTDRLRWWQKLARTAGFRVHPRVRTYRVTAIVTAGD